MHHILFKFPCSGSRDRTYDQSLTFCLLLLEVWTISSPYIQNRTLRGEALRTNNIAGTTLLRDSLYTFPLITLGTWLGIAP